MVGYCNLCGEDIGDCSCGEGVAKLKTEIARLKAERRIQVEDMFKFIGDVIGEAYNSKQRMHLARRIVDFVNGEGK